MNMGGEYDKSNSWITDQRRLQATYTYYRFNTNWGAATVFRESTDEYGDRYGIVLDGAIIQKPTKWAAGPELALVHFYEQLKTIPQRMPGLPCNELDLDSVNVINNAFEAYDQGVTVRKVKGN